jgi:hypothetical protein
MPEAARPVWRWSTGGGGGTVWNAIAVDPESNRFYVGTGNARGTAAPPNRFACSVVALNADTGEPVWNYDAAPGDHLTCDSSTDLTLATLSIDGQPRAVIIHAPKDGTIHVLDRATGKAISSRKLGVGAHNHFAQAFSPKTGLVYLPTNELPDSNPDGEAPADAGKSALLAWDPVKQRPVWAQPRPVRTAVGCSRRQAISFSRARPTAISLRIPPPKVAASGPSTQLPERSERQSHLPLANASTSRFSPDPRRASPAASAKCRRASVGIRAHILEEF